MKTLLNPYISFKDNAREAMEFYHTVFGGKIELHTFNEFQASHGAGDDNKIMHSMIEAENGITFMGSDTPTGMEYHDGKRISMSLSGENEEEIRGYWDKLVEGGQINMPLEKAPWGDTFGMLTDKFGIDWMLNITGKKE
jgi:PhnB protein